MAITSNEPWTTKQVGQETLILDAQGRAIGLFHDWQDAEQVMNLKSEVIKLTNNIEKLETDLDGMEQVLAEEMNAK